MIAKQPWSSTAARRARPSGSSRTLEDIDDVQRVTANFDIPEEIFAEVAG